MSDRTDAITLRSWAADAATVFNNWPTLTAAQKDADMRVLVQRLGVLASHLADQLDHNSFSD